MYTCIYGNRLKVERNQERMYLCDEEVWGHGRGKDSGRELQENRDNRRVGETGKENHKNTLLKNVMMVQNTLHANLKMKTQEGCWENSVISLVMQLLVTYSCHR